MLAPVALAAVDGAALAAAPSSAGSARAATASRANVTFLPDLRVPTHPAVPTASSRSGALTRKVDDSNSRPGHGITPRGSTSPQIPSPHIHNLPGALIASLPISRNATPSTRWR